jgi:hypothetical protein
LNLLTNKGLKGRVHHENALGKSSQKRGVRLDQSQRFFVGVHEEISP